MSRPIVYLAGPITGLEYDESEDWRLAARNMLPRWIATASPLRNKEYLRVFGKLPAHGYGSTATLSTNAGIRCRDRMDVTRSAAVLMNLAGATRVSIGSMIELGWADAANTPVVLVMEETNLHQHAIVNAIPGFIVPTLEQGCAVIASILSPHNPE